MSFKQEGAISTLSGENLKLGDNFAYLHSSVSSTESDITLCLAKARTAIDRLSITWKSDLSDKIKRDFFQAMAMLILLYRCTIWTLTKCIEKKLDGNYTRMLRAIWNKIWKQHPSKQQRFGKLPPISKAIKARRIKMRNIAREAKTLFCGPLLRAVPVLADQQELIYISSVRTQDVIWPYIYYQFYHIYPTPPLGQDMT